MKRVVIWWAVLGLCAATAGRAQDAATEERLNKLNGNIEDLSTRLEQQHQENERLKREVAALQEQLAKPTPNYATIEYVNKLAEAIEKVDRSRLQDNRETRATVDARVDELIVKIKALHAILAATPPPVAPTVHRAPPPTVDPTPVDTKPTQDETGFWYKVEQGDTVSAIIQACREKNIRVTKDQILKANPTLKPERMIVGTKIWIPVAKP